VRTTCSTSILSREPASCTDLTPVSITAQGLGFGPCCPLTMGFRMPKKTSTREARKTAGGSTVLLFLMITAASIPSPALLKEFQNSIKSSCLVMRWNITILYSLCKFFLILFILSVTYCFFVLILLTSRLLIKALVMPNLKYLSMSVKTGVWICVRNCRNQTRRVRNLVGNMVEG
jgi:hypothetical protein